MYSSEYASTTAGQRERAQQPQRVHIEGSSRPSITGSVARSPYTTPEQAVPMSREVTHEENGPRILTPDDIDPEKGDVAICLCGLSNDYPFCDGSHEATVDEEPGVRYKYEDDDPDGERHIVEYDFESGE